MQIAQKNFYKKFLGRIGEKQAANHLVKEGYKILEKNYRTHLGEIDIIAEDGDTLVFIEVKTRSGDGYGAPSEAVDKRKQAKYYKVAEEYLIRHKRTEDLCRFDVMEIENERINIIKDAFST